MMYRFLILSILLFSGCSAQKPSFEKPEVVLFITPSSQKTTQSSSSFSLNTSANTPLKSMMIDVPFQPQAPFATWDALHEEACEEMSLLLVHHVQQGSSLSQAQAEEELQALIAWETEHGFAHDVSVGQLATIAERYFGYQTRVIDDPTAEDLRRELSRGNPILFPAAGRLLRNPFFSGEGPAYHMIVLIGYDERGFITHDVGTKRGEQYWYSTETIMNALHDWTGDKETIEQGEKRVMVVEG
jgi:hypothetical protein